MKRRKNVYAAVCALAMLVVILDTKTALGSAKEGIRQCLQTLIPALFPYFLLSGILSSAMLGSNFRLLRPLCRACCIPDGCSSLLLLGSISGYPVGAKCVADAWKSGSIDKNTAKRLLGFCSNAGPAMIFGMGSILFTDPRVPWCIWGIHILSAILTGVILPGRDRSAGTVHATEFPSLATVMERSVKITGVVCGWVILFRILLGFLIRWFLWLLPVPFQVGIIGILELSNGFLALPGIASAGLRMVVCCGLTSFGGLCVLLQTTSAVGHLGLGYYFPGKLIQATLSILLAVFIQPLLFRGSDLYRPHFALCLLALVFLVCFRFLMGKRKKVVAFPGKLLYNSKTEK